MQVMKFPSGLYWVIPYNDIISSYILSACLGMDIMLWTSVKDFGDYHISEQGRLRWTCAVTQSCQSFCSSHAQSMEVEKCSEQNLEL